MIGWSQQDFNTGCGEPQQNHVFPKGKRRRRGHDGGDGGDGGDGFMGQKDNPSDQHVLLARSFCVVSKKTADTIICCVFLICIL